MTAAGQEEEQDVGGADPAVKQPNAAQDVTQQAEAEETVQQGPQLPSASCGAASAAAAAAAALQQQEVVKEEGGAPTSLPEHPQPAAVAVDAAASAEPSWASGMGGASVADSPAGPAHARPAADPADAAAPGGAPSALSALPAAAAAAPPPELPFAMTPPEPYQQPAGYLQGGRTEAQQQQQQQLEVAEEPLAPAADASVAVTLQPLLQMPQAGPAERLQQQQQHHPDDNDDARSEGGASAITTASYATAHSVDPATGQPISRRLKAAAAAGGDGGLTYAQRLEEKRMQQRRRGTHKAVPR